MTKPKSRGSKTLIVRVPAELHDMLKKLASQMNVTITYLIVNYLRYLKNKDYREREDAVITRYHSLPVGTKKTDFKIEEEVEDDLV